MMDTLAMGDYSAYVWTCVALTAVVVVVCEWRARIRHRRVFRDIEVRVKALGDRE